MYIIAIPMKDQIKTVRGRVIFLVAVFALVITFLALVFSFNIIYSYQRKIAVRSAEFNLQLVAGLIDQDLRDLSFLGRWCGNSEDISTYFMSEDQLNLRSMDAWRKLSDEYLNNRSGRYLRRLIVSDTSLTKLLQVGNQITTKPVSVYTLGLIFETGVEKDSRPAEWQALIADPYTYPGDTLVIPFVYPVYNFLDGSEIGTVFLAANTAIITDKLRDYYISGGSGIYLSIGEKYYAIENNEILPGEFPYRYTGGIKEETEGSAASVMEARDTAGRRHILVSYPIRDELSLVEVLSPAHYLAFSGAWPALAAGFGALIVLLFVMAFGVSRMVRQISLLLNKTLEDEKNKRDLEYRMLQSQINPHFLYNTLNSIKWMATIQNAGGIAEMTTALSRFLKIISKETRELVPLKDELLLLEDYLIIQKYRYGGSINFESKVAEEYLDTLIPRFTLQPLTENAIFHGIEPKGSGNIVLSAERQEADVLISLRDDGVGIGAVPDVGALPSANPSSPEDSPEHLQGLGIRSVNERLRYAFGDGYGLSIDSKPGSYTTVTIRLPGAGK